VTAVAKVAPVGTVDWGAAGVMATSEAARMAPATVVARVAETAAEGLSVVAVLAAP